MSLKIYNTLKRKKEIFKSIKPKEVGMYVCGPTVNDIPHLGHARVQIFFDVFRRYLEFLGNKVIFVSNITDIEDKIIKKASELGITPEKLSKLNEKAHLEDYDLLRIKKPIFQPHATEYIPQMIKLIKLLEEKGFTYVVEGDGVYYNISKFKNYGQLSKINLEELKNKRNLKDSSKGQEKKDSKDFVLWKFSKPGEPEWNSPWGKGRPGWHIECSTMTHEILGNPFDIHGGGQDLIFPHHEDEIAQSEAGYGKKMVNYWVHNGMINIDKVKMSKSLGNYKTIRDLLKKYSPEVLRYFILKVHYRKPIDFSFDKLDEAKKSHESLKNLISTLEDDSLINDSYLKEFQKEMDDDLNTSGALNVLWKLIRDKTAKGKIKTIKKMEEIFNLNLFEKNNLKLPKEIKNLLEQRKKARENKNWQFSDELREKIKEKGFEVLDTSDGQKIKN